MKLRGNIDELRYSTPGSAGVDLRSTVDITIHPDMSLDILYFTAAAIIEQPDFQSAQQYLIETFQNRDVTVNRQVVPTGVYIESAEPDELVWITPRSGLAAKKGITVLNTPGLVDSDYPGELGVIIINHSTEPLEIKVGDRIAQAVLMRYDKFENIPSSETERTGGMGSTGVQ